MTYAKQEALSQAMRLMVALLLFAGLGACSGVATKNQHDNQPVDTDDAVVNKQEHGDEAFALAWQTLRNPSATYAEITSAIDTVQKSPSKMQVARLSFEKQSESQIRSLLKEPVYINLSHADLSGYDLSGLGFMFVDLRGTNLSNANLSGSDFRFLDLSGANLSGANLTDANFADAKLSEVNFSNANLFNADLAQAEMTGADLSGADLSKARSLNDSDLDEACGDEKTALPAGFSIPPCN